MSTLDLDLEKWSEFELYYDVEFDIFPSPSPNIMDIVKVVMRPRQEDASRTFSKVYSFPPPEPELHTTEYRLIYFAKCKIIEDFCSNEEKQNIEEIFDPNILDKPQKILEMVKMLCELNG